MRDTVGELEFDAKAAFAEARRRGGTPRPVGAGWGGWGAVACPRARHRDALAEPSATPADTSASRSARVPAAG